MFYPAKIVPDTIIVFLEHEGEQGFQVDTMTMLPNPAITQLTSQAGLYHISTNLEIQRVAEQLYFHNCETEAKSIKNWQNVLAKAQEGMSLKPYFDDGYMAVPAATAVHILKCDTLEAYVDFDKVGCFSELPLKLKNADGTFSNESFWAHPISKILLPTETVVPCNKKLPQVYRLDGVQTHYCSFGHGLAPCPAPQVLTPTSADLHNQLKNDIAVPMGAGVMSKAKRREMQFRVFYHQYAKHLENEILARNEEAGIIANGLDLRNIPSHAELLDIEWTVASSIAPFYTLFGDFYVYIIGAVMLATIIGAIFGLVARIYTELTVNGFSIKIFLAIFQGLYHVTTVPIEFLKAGYKGTVKHAYSGVDAALEPLNEKIAKLEAELARLQLNPNNPSRSASNKNNHGNPFNPPSYYSGHGGSTGGQGNVTQKQPSLFKLGETTPDPFSTITDPTESTNLLHEETPGLRSNRQPSDPGASIEMQNLQKSAPVDSPDVLNTATPSAPPRSPTPPALPPRAHYDSQGPYNSIASTVRSEWTHQAAHPPNSWHGDKQHTMAQPASTMAAAATAAAAAASQAAVLQLAATATAAAEPLVDLAFGERRNDDVDSPDTSNRTKQSKMGDSISKIIGILKK